MLHCTIRFLSNSLAFIYYPPLFYSIDFFITVILMRYSTSFSVIVEALGTKGVFNFKGAISDAEWTIAR